MNQSEQPSLPVARPVRPLQTRGFQEPIEAENALSRYLPLVVQLGEQLRQTSSQIETSVLDVCDSFQRIALRAKATVRKGRTFLSHGSDGEIDGGFARLIGRCEETLVKVLRVTQVSGEISRRAVDRIKQIHGASEKIDLALEQLEQITAGNRIMALNARIEAAHAGEKGAGFAVVAMEVAAQAERSQRVTAEMSTLVEQLRALAASTLNDLEEMIARDQIQVERCRLEVNRSLEDLQTSHRAIEDVLANMAEDGETIAADIGVAVRGMQFQDRVSQRIAHVVGDLTSLHACLSQHICGIPHDEVENGVHFSEYTMREERLVAGITTGEAPAGDIELF